VQRGAHGEAVDRLRRGLERAPNSSRLALLLAWELATAPDAALRDPAEAEALSRRVAAAYPADARAADVLAAALAAQGRFDVAVPVAERALAAARAAGDRSLVPQIAARLTLYRRGEAYRQPTRTAQAQAAE
jgi:tetratricopeptide (TPR) repeat protein